MAEPGQAPKKRKTLNAVLEVLEDLWIVALLFIVGLFVLFWLSTKVPAGSSLAISSYYLLISSPVWLSVLLLVAGWNLWIEYIRALTISKIKPILLEIKLPQEVNRSPLAMEIVFSVLYQKGATSFLEQYWLGKIRPWFSLELVSLGGQVHLYIWTDDKFRNIIEAQIYAQYPNVAIHEVDDYTPNVVWNPDKYIMWGTHFILTDPEVYPIKTYVDYGLDRPGQEEEEKIDPLTSMLEYLGSLKPGEQAWIQILIQAHKKEGIKEGRLIEKVDWKKAARDEIAKIKKEATPERPGSEFPGFPNPTKGQQEKIAALERSINKSPFETMIRGFYIAEKSSFTAAGIPGLISSIRAFSSQDLNGFKLGWFTDHQDTGKDLVTAFGWITPFGNYMQHRRNLMEQKMLDAYKKRSIFHAPYKNFHNKPYILNAEELATIFHIPGRVATTPTLQKMESKRAEPPRNLPM